MVSPGKQRVLITGISGFTGRHLAKSLDESGYEVVGMGPERLPLESEHADIDLADAQALCQWVRSVNPTHVVHLAAISHVVGDAISFYKVNLLGTENLFEALAAASTMPVRVLVASSANVYGNAKHSPISEDAPVNPVNHYALSKLAMELMANKWSERFPLSTVRPFNYTGPGQSESFLVPKIVGAFRRRDAVLKLGNIDVARDISDVSYVVDAYRRLLEINVKTGPVNVCSGRSISINQILQIMTDMSGYRPDVKIDPALVRKDEIKELCGDPSRLNALIGPLMPPDFRTTLTRMFHDAPVN